MQPYEEVLKGRDGGWLVAFLISRSIFSIMMTMKYSNDPQPWLHIRITREALNGYEILM